MHHRYILLVEDDDILALQETKILEKHAFKILRAVNSDQAIYLLKKAPELNLILMDIDLGPGKNGLETARLILAVQDIPIVFLSSQTDPEIFRLAQKTSPYGFVNKNAKELTLLAAINTALKMFEERHRLQKLQQEKMALDLILHKTIENPAQTVWFVDQNLRLIRANKNFFDRIEFAMGHRPLLGDNVLNFLPKTIEAEWLDHYQRGLRGEKFEIQTHWVPPLAPRRYRYQFNPILDSPGETVILGITGEEIGA